MWWPVFVGGFLVWAAVSLTAHQEATGNHAPRLALLGVIAVLVGAWIVFAIWRLTQLRVVLSTDGLEVHNFWRTRRIRWAEISSVTSQRYSSVAQGRRAYFAPAVMLREGKPFKFGPVPLPSGPMVRMEAFPPSWGSDSKGRPADAQAAAAAIDALERACDTAGVRCRWKGSGMRAKPEGKGWRRASDGMWYPPSLPPDPLPPPPASADAAPSTPTATEPESPAGPVAS
jgi:hypothetical protein